MRHTWSKISILYFYSIGCFGLDSSLDLIIFIFLHSAWNPRTNAYKNAAFDILFDHEASQGQIFAECGVPNLIKQVVSVSSIKLNLNQNHLMISSKQFKIILWTSVLVCRATIRQSSPTDKQALERLTVWRATNTAKMTKVSPLQSLKQERTKASYPDLFGFSSRWSSSREAPATRSSPYIAPTYKSIKKECTICWISHTWSA